MHRNLAVEAVIENTSSQKRDRAARRHWEKGEGARESLTDMLSDGSDDEFPIRERSGRQIVQESNRRALLAAQATVKCGLYHFSWV